MLEKTKTQLAVILSIQSVLLHLQEGEVRREMRWVLRAAFRHGSTHTHTHALYTDTHTQTHIHACVQCTRRTTCTISRYVPGFSSREDVTDLVLRQQERWGVHTGFCVWVGGSTMKTTQKKHTREKEGGENRRIDRCEGVYTPRSHQECRLSE